MAYICTKELKRVNDLLTQWTCIYRKRDHRQWPGYVIFQTILLSKLSSLATLTLLKVIVYTFGTNADPVRPSYHGLQYLQSRQLIFNG